MRYDLRCSVLEQNAASVLPQIHRAGCDEIITTFVPASARLLGFVCNKTRPEFCFIMKQNTQGRLLGRLACFKQPLNARNGRRWRSSMTWRRIKFSFFMATESASHAIRFALFTP
jgi:hypothetical protein